MARQRTVRQLAQCRKSLGKYCARPPPISIRQGRAANQPSPQVIMVHGLSIPYRLNLAQARQAAQLRTDQCHQMVPGREPFDVFVPFVPLHDRREAPPRKRFQQIAEHRIFIAHAKLSILSLINQKDIAKPRRRLACNYYQSIFPRTALRRWENPKSGKSGYAPVYRNEWIRGVCGKPQVKCCECPNQAFVPFGVDIIRSHLAGRATSNATDFTAGIYPMLPDETCWFLAADFDKKSWKRDVVAFRDTARAKGVPVAIERSRSGSGAHAWIFFEEPVAAGDARHLGALLVTATMDRCPDIGFDSYDRFFPSQDTMPAGGFGNLIALPFQSRPRENGNSVFVDDDFHPYEDQWAYLSTLHRLSRSEMLSIVTEAATAGQIFGVQFPPAHEDDQPWTTSPSRRNKEPPIEGPLPKSVEVVLGNQIYIDRSKLPPGLVTRIARLAAFQNPEFYTAQAMRLATFGKPRVISCAELFSKHVALPRGCLDGLMGLLDSVGIAAELRDERQQGQLLAARFLGELTSEQSEAAATLLKHETGVLAAATAFGKTVVAAKMIAARGRNTLVLVHRRQLLEQWVARLQAFLDIPPGGLGIIHGGKKRPTGIVDVALMQSLIRRGAVSDLVADYGHVVVDECHHLSAVGFEAIARAAKARYVLGLSATVTRKDGHHPIIFMQCGPVRYRVDARKQAASRPFEHKVIFRRTARFRFLDADRMSSRQYRSCTRSSLRTLRAMI